MKSLLLDLRLGLPSASIMGRLAECSGSLALANWVKRNGYFVPKNPWALNGTRIHHWLKLETLGGDPDDLKTASRALNGDGLEVARKCAELREQIVDYWISGEHACETIIEKRFWYRDLFSGQPDYVLIDYANNRALCINYKSGRTEAEPAADNYQLRTEVVLLKAAFPKLEEIQAVIIEPLVSWDSERVQYSGENFRKAEEEILQIVDQATWRPERRVAGPWCQYCPARLYCREAINYVESALINIETVKLRELPVGEDGVRLWERIAEVPKYIQAIKAAYEEILRNDPGALPGYILPEEGRERREVKSAAALKRALAAYLSADEIDSCATYWVSKVEERFGKKAGLAGVERERKFSELVADVIETTHDRPFIRPLTKKERLLHQESQ